MARPARIPAVSDILHIPFGRELIAFVALGYSSQTLKVSEGRRVPVMERTFLDYYGQEYQK
jgi:hypothetical protein